MGNLRIINVEIVDSSQIEVKFSNTLVSNLTTANVSIISETTGVPDSEVLSVKVNKEKLIIGCQPLTVLATYYLEFKSTTQYPFISRYAEDVLSEDGVSNKYIFTGPLESDNPSKEYFHNYLKDNLYNLDDDNSLVSKYIKSLSLNFSKALYDIRQVKNENYLSFTVVDEQKVRGKGPFDRLNEEGAYEITRVARTTSETNASSVLSITDFPSYPITLQKQSATESLTKSTEDVEGGFNITNLVMTLSNKPITKVTSIVFTFTTANPIYTYSISTLGYQLLNSRYDQDYSSTYLLLENNQVRLNEAVLQDSDFSLHNLLKVDVEYEYKDLGLVIDPNTVSVTVVKEAIRETLPSIINIFQLKHAPIVDSNGDVPSLAGITFSHPDNILGASHDAFLYEIPFRLNGLPSLPGQYSIDYTTGTVYVYGADSTNDGTGPYPPLATYNYKFTYKTNIDYTYDDGLRELVALPYGSLINEDGDISFSYEHVLVPDVDYIANPHKEVLDERVNNKLLALNAIRVKNGPITNVFRIFNETTGEIYNLSRWYGDKIYFRYNTPPRVFAQKGERVAFHTVTNKVLFVNSTLTNSSALTVFKILLEDNNIIAASEDCLASSVNTSLTFSDGNVFVSEKWYNISDTVTGNIDYLTEEGEYCVDYANGIIYCAVSSTQNNNLGTCSYKINKIDPVFPHLISVDDIYFRLSILNGTVKQFNYTSFDDDEVLLDELKVSDEKLLNEDNDSPYQVSDNEIGIFSNSTFVPGVTYQVKDIRGIYEVEDLKNSTKPINFALGAEYDSFNITAGTISKEVFTSIEYDGYYYVTINENIPYLSSQINYEFSVERLSDSQELWDNSGVVNVGNPVTLQLSGTGTPAAGELVKITYTFSIKDLSIVVVDYNKGDLYIDYTYLGDEIIVSYEYGDNVLDFRQSNSVPADTTYYVTYKVGALRDALLSNFGNLVNVPELLNFDIDFDRERYRDALTAALSSFIKGPTLSAIKNIATTISHNEPEINESVFEGWSLGSSILNPEEYSTTGEFSLLPGKFNNGVLIDGADQTIKFPINSNLRLEEGTFETWITPQWAGLDNDASLTFTVLKDGYAIDAEEIFIGAGEFHPTITDGVFVLDKLSNVFGTPNKNKDGIFIYYDLDATQQYYRWYVEVIDGYVSTPSNIHKIKINSSGSFYDAKMISGSIDSDTTLFTGINSITITLKDGYGAGYDKGITFISDVDHYILDCGKDKNHSRISIYKDVSGYLNFRIFDNQGNSYVVSSDVSSWQPNEQHFIATSWKLNSRNERDEIHLFIDGMEVPNIVKYGQRFIPKLHEKFRTVNPEEIIGLSNRDIISSTDLSITSGSNVVSSSINFSAYNIFAGDTIFIDEEGFSSSGYTINTVSGQDLTLDTAMPATLSDGRFSINRTEYSVYSEIDIYPNTAISTISVFTSGNDLSGTIGTSTVTSATADFEDLEVEVGFLLRIDGYTSPITYVISDVSTNTLTISGELPATFSNAEYFIYSNEETEIPGVRALNPAYSISKDGYFNNILTVSNSVFDDDLILIRTLGVNHRKFKKQYYVWGDGYENILMTRLPPPISLDEAKVTKIILPPTIINSNNGTFAGAILTSDQLTVYPTTESVVGRTLSITISGNNVDFATNVDVIIDGYSGAYPATETISFTDYGTLDTSYQYSSINYVQVVVQPINASKTAVTVQIKEKYSMTYAESSEAPPVIKYSYQMDSGVNLYSSGADTVTDGYKTFSHLYIGNYLIINYPSSVAGYYKILGVSEDRTTLTIEATTESYTLPLTSFTGGYYQIVNVNSYRSGLQNGFFTFEYSTMPFEPYMLRNGFYEFEYYTYASMKFDPLNGYLFLGSDFNGQLQLNAIMDQVKIYSTMLTDTRIGETVASNENSVTKDFNSLKPLKADSTTLLLTNFDNFPFSNEAKYYFNFNLKKHFQSSIAVNENFNNSIVILDQPIVVDNDGILDTRKEGTIEFWVNPIYDSSNDPHERYYFDAFGAVLEDAVSINNVSVKIPASIGEVISVKVKNGDPKIDYFAGGRVEIDTQNAYVEEVTSIGNSSLTTSKTVLQVISVKVVGDYSNFDYFKGGSIGSDNKTIYLGTTLPANNMDLTVTYQPIDKKNVQYNSQIIRLNKKLPYQNCPIVVNYIPKGLQGDRISLFKDNFGYLNFKIIASGTEYVLRAPTRWAKGSWHRVKASYRVNNGYSQDEMRLFVDGYQYSNLSFGDTAIAGSTPFLLGSGSIGDGYGFLNSIKFKDPINQLFIGSEYNNEHPAFVLLDNLRISNIFRPIYAPYGEPLDVSWSSNTEMVLPVTEDLFTTYLMDYDSLVKLNEDFATIRNRQTGAFDFSMNIFDSFGIVSSSPKVKEILEKLIKILKPANSKVFLNYVK
jgi:hypothetical protein